VPEGGAMLAGMFFPEGTSVGCMPSAVHMNRAVYGQDVEVFRPERFLEGDAETLRKREISHLGFSRGKRVCLGQNIAMLQMKKVIPALVMGFEVCAVFLTSLWSDSCIANPHRLFWLILMQNLKRTMQPRLWLWIHSLSFSKFLTIRSNAPSTMTAARCLFKSRDVWRWLKFSTVRNWKNL
jgi:hypothetical protein